MRLGGRMQPIDGIGRERDGGIEPEAVRRADDVVVDRLGDADDGNAAKEELVSDRQRAVAPDDDQRAESHLVEHLHDTVGVVVRALGGGDRMLERDRRD